MSRSGQTRRRRKRLERATIRRRDDLFASARRGERALRHQPTLGEELIAGNAMAARDERHALPRQVGLLDDPGLFFRCPAPRNIVSHASHFHKCEALSGHLGGYLIDPHDMTLRGLTADDRSL